MAEEDDTINYLLLIELIVIVIVASAFLFYWNRLIASVAAFFIRLYTWRYHNAYISIGSLQVSPLAGRVAFRDIEYHSSNVSFRALHGHLTFRYWWVRVRQEGDSLGSNKRRKSLPCRISVYARGVEGFVYNRTPAYDAIVERMKKHEREEEESAKTSSSSQTSATEKKHLRARLRKVHGHAQSSAADGVGLDPTSSNETSDYPPKTHALPSEQPKEPSAPDDGADWFREAMPVELKVESGSIVLGSDATPTVLIGDFKRVEGVIEVMDSRSVFDRYKTVVELHFQEPTVLMRTNVDWSGPLLAHGKKAYDELLKREPSITKQPPSNLSIRSGFQALVKRFPFLRDPKFSSPPMAGLPADRVWKGLARYRLETDDGSRRANLKREEREYAKVTTLLESVGLDMTYYVDTPGIVPMPSEVDHVDETDKMGNVDMPPEYGIDVVVHGGTVKYGPWADRQRDALQRAFAPSIFFDTEPRKKLRPGDARLHTNLIVNLLLAEDTTLRIPTREPSKDWMFDTAPAETDRRYGWLDVTVGADSSIVYTQAQYATYNGYDSMVVLHLDSLEIASSVNLQTFVRAKACRLSVTMPTPLQWNAQRDWGLDLTLESPDITLLRDHVTLIADVAKDWSSGAVGDFHHFVPMHYNFRVALLNYAFHLYINDFNIVDKPTSRSDNAFMDVCGPQLISYTAVASTQYRPELSVIPFTVDLKDARVDIVVPRWDTHQSFGAGESLEVGKIGHVHASGTYRYYSTPSPDHQETLSLHLEGSGVVFKALGWVLRRLFCVKDNYFGGFTQFTTMQEYLERFDHDPDSVGDPVEEKYRPGRSDSFAVNVTMNVEDSLILMADEIYACERGLVMPVPQLQMALKSTEHFMELSLDSPPTYIVPSKDLSGVYLAGVAPSVGRRDAVFLEGITLKANRLFGPQPRATTYLCLWECVLPNVTAFLSPTFMHSLQASIRAVAFNFVDSDNAPTPVYIPRSPPDVTFFKLTLEAASIAFFADDSAVYVDLPAGMSLDTSSLATRTCGSVVGVLMPAISLDLLRRSPDRRKWTSVSTLSSGLSLDVYQASRNWREKASAQQDFIRKEDGPTQRIWYMYRDGGETTDEHHADGVYLPRPGAEKHNLDDDNNSLNDADDSLDIPASSSGSPNDEEHHDLRSRSLAGRRSRSFATARETIGEDDLDDESDTTSTFTSSTDSEDTGHSDESMPSAFAAKLRQLRSIKTSSRGRSGVPISEKFIGDSMRPSPPQPGFAYGKIFRAAVEPITIDFQASGVACISEIGRALEDEQLRSEQILDSLLIGQVDSVLDEDTSDPPVMVDVSLPAIVIHLATATEDYQVVSETNLAILKTVVSVRRSKQENDAKVVVDLITERLSLGISSTGGAKLETSLADANITPSEDDTVTVLRLSGHDLNLKVRKDDYGTMLHAQAKEMALDTVSGAIPLIADTASRWRSLVAELPDRSEPELLASDLLADIVGLVEDSQMNLSYPAFASVSAYGLHVEDQRNIRVNLGWWFLARMRHWHQLGPEGQRHEVVRPSTPDLVNTIVEQLARIGDPSGATEALIRDQWFVRKALSLKLAPPVSPKDPLDPYLGFFFYAGRIALNHYGRLLGSKAIGRSSVTFACTSIGYHRSFANKHDEVVHQGRAVAALGTIDVELRDSVLSAVHSVVSLGRDRDTQATSEEVAEPARPPAIILLDLQIGNANFGLTAGGLRLQLSVRGLQHVLTHQRDHRSRNGERQLVARNSVILTIDGCEVTLYFLASQNEAADHKADRIVVVTALEGVRALAESRGSTDASTRQVIRSSAGVRSIRMDSRPQLRAFVRFAHDWKHQHFQNYQRTFDELGVMVAARPTRVPPSPAASRIFKLDLLVDSASIQIRAAKAVWLQWDMGRVFVCRSGPPGQVRFGVRVAPQVVGAHATRRPTKTRDASSVRLPSIEATGTVGTKNGQTAVNAKVDLGFFTGIIKPALLDRLLSLHQRLGEDVMEVVQDFREAIKVILRKRHSKESSTATFESTPAGHVPAKALLDLHIGVAGVRFGLRADDVATTLLFEALSLKARATNISTPKAAMLWRAKIDHIGISLGQLGTGALTEESEPMRKYRSAYMVLDVEVQEIPGAAQAASQLSVSLNRVHTVMHVAALSEITDLIKSWTSDIHILHDNRSVEVEEFKQHTTKILRKIETVERGTQPEASWFASRLLTVEVVGLGIAIPLADEMAIDLREHGDVPVPALLFSIRLISFQNKRNETARFRVQQMALQFLHKFDQGIPEHFAGDFHPSRNRMSLPSIDAEAQMSSKPEEWCLAAHGSATDFKLSLAPDVADGVFQLIDLYSRGKDHVSLLEQHYRAEMSKREHLESMAAKYEEATPSPIRRDQRIMIRMSFTFNSGVVEMHRSVANAEMIRSTTADPRGRSNRIGWHDTFTLPSISVWTDFAGSQNCSAAEGSDPRSFIFNSAVHESHNILRPSILPFFVELARRVERRVKEHSPTSPVRPPEASTILGTSTSGGSALDALAGSSTGKLRVQVSLRIDRSLLRFSCAPDSNAYLDLKWESGGFLASTTLGTQSVSTVAGSISGVTISLSHEFAELGRSCIEASATDMASSVIYNPIWREGQRGLSIVVDTQISAQFRLEAFSAWLIFVSVWVDNAPIIDIPMRVTAPETSPAAGAMPQEASKIGIAVLARIKAIEFDANIAVSHARLAINPIVLRTLADGETTLVNLQIGVTEVSAQGDISGNIRSDRLAFHTTRRSSRAGATSDPTVLKMSIEGGDLSGSLFLGDTNIVRFTLNPSEVTLVDDWRAFMADPAAQVMLSFSVRAGELQGAVRLLAIPRLLGNIYSILDMVDSQNKVASQRSETFKTRQLRKATDPSPVAIAILQTVHKAGPSGAKSSIKTAQSMEFDLSGIDIGVFNEDYDQGQISDFYRFVVGKVKADLKREQSKEGLPKRTLGLLVSYVRWDTSDGQQVATDETKEMTARQLIDKAVKHGRREVASLPSMTLTMESLQLPDPPTIEYDFSLIWGETDGDVAILPNFFEQAFRAFQKLLAGLDEQELARARRLGVAPKVTTASARGVNDENGKEDTSGNLKYRRRNAIHAGAMPIPRLKLLGEGTTDAAKLVPKIKSAVNELPSMSHRFVTLPLEEGMDLLLKLYEKQLPDRGP